RMAADRSVLCRGNAKPSPAMRQADAQPDLPPYNRMAAISLHRYTGPGLLLDASMTPTSLFYRIRRAVSRPALTVPPKPPPVNPGSRNFVRKSGAAPSQDQFPVVVRVDALVLLGQLGDAVVQRMGNVVQAAPLRR